MPFLRFLSGFGEKNGRKVVLEPPDLRTNCACNRHLSLQLVASGLDPLPTYLSMWAGQAIRTYIHVHIVSFDTQGACSERNLVWLVQGWSAEFTADT